MLVNTNSIQFCDIIFRNSPVFPSYKKKQCWKSKISSHQENLESSGFIDYFMPLYKLVQTRGVLRLSTATYRQNSKITDGQTLLILSDSSLYMIHLDLGPFFHESLNQNQNLLLKLTLCICSAAQLFSLDTDIVLGPTKLYIDIVQIICPTDSTFAVFINSFL